MLGHNPVLYLLPGLNLDLESKQTGLCLEIYFFFFNQTSALNTSKRGFGDVICVVVNDFNSDAKNNLKYLVFPAAMKDSISWSSTHPRACTIRPVK